MRARDFLTSLVLLAAVLAATARAQDGGREDAGVEAGGNAVSYRDAYRAMVRFDKYGGPKTLLVNELQVLPREHGGLMEGDQLTLTGRTVHVNLPLDALGRTVFPLQKAAYDENAALALNRKGVPFTLRASVALAPRPDGRYDAAELRAGCVQALGFARWVDASQASRQCVGVRFVFGKKTDSAVHVRHADGLDTVLPASEGDAGTAAVTYRFGGGAERAQVVTVNAPLAILPLIE
jgi:hypothetical protein